MPGVLLAIALQALVVMVTFLSLKLLKLKQSIVCLYKNRAPETFSSPLHTPFTEENVHGIK